jgi:hypothetical protein
MIHKTENDMIAKVNAALHAAMAGVIARARLRNSLLVVSRHGEVIEVNPHELELPSLTDEQLRQSSRPSTNNN